MSLPDQLTERVAGALLEKGLGSRIESATAVGGGCINNAVRIQTETGSAAFLKWNAHAPTGMFAAEEDGLRALRAQCVLRVPEPLARSQPADGNPAWLLLEYIPSGPPTPGVDHSLGRGLAQLHVRRPEASFGWTADNWIGSTPQANASTPSWPDFWWDRRLSPMLVQARRGGFLKDQRFDRLQEIMAEALGDITEPCLVHGDLWGGNTFASLAGEAVVIDPAVYFGHGEVDLAMTELFGGFGPAFYEAYRSEGHVSRAYEAYRRDLYQLYYLLVHVNLFGSGYEAGCRKAAERVLVELTQS